MTLTPEQVQAQVAAIRNRNTGDSRVVALRHSGGWPGPERLTIAGQEHRVISCVSDLQAREALSQLEGENASGVLLCDLEPSNLGEDVLARLIKRRVHNPQMGEILRELFSARLVDARVLACRPLVDALVRSASSGAYSPAPGATLDMQFAWKALLRKLLGFEVSDITFAELLRWTTVPTARTAVAGLGAELRQEFARWLAPTAGEAPKHFFHALDSELGSDLVALGLLMGMITTAEKAGVAEAQAAAARLEQYLGNEPIAGPDRQIWYQAASELYRGLLETQVFQAQAVIQNLDGLIERVRLQTQAHFSDYSRAGLEQRIGATGDAIRMAAGSKAEEDLEAARQALDRVAKHNLANDDGLRLRRLHMSLRLLLWSRAGGLPGPDSTLSQLCSYYGTEGGFVDWARNLVVESDPSPEAKKGLHAVLEQVDPLWTNFQRQFASRLQQWAAQDSKLDRVLRIEEVLWSVAAPVAKQMPALLIVLDGMSQAVFREIMSDLMRRNWVEVGAPTAEVPRLALAVVPSVTEISRRALLSGQLPLPAEGTEKTDFARNSRLFEHVGGAVRPQLFLKGDLVETGRPGLAPAVGEAIADEKCHLVAVVVNAVDDSLGSTDQTSYSWSLDQIAPLHELMRLASECGRAVILTSDHGHVLDEGSRLVQQPLPDTGDRYRLPSGPVADGELEIRGPRVKAATGAESIVTLAAPRLRYQLKSRGYHGGICPQEMLVPCVVLRSSNAKVPETWEDLPPFEPEWWSPRPVLLSAVAPAQRVAPPRKTPSKQPELFEKAGVLKSGASWIDDLLASPTYREQAQAAVRGAPPVEQIKKFLALVEQRNGRIQRGHLAQQMGIALIRVDGLVQNYRRLLNLDGYDVLSYDTASETVVLNIELLKSQFQI